MQLFPCPFCGPRIESEFFYMGDAHNLRPEGHTAVSWSAYLYFKNNPKGAADEIWTHLACGELFRMERNTVDHRVFHSETVLLEECE